MLHMEPREQEQPSPKTQQQNEETVMSASTSQKMDGGRVLLKVRPVTIKGPNGVYMDIYALLDEGSTTTLIDEDIAKMIQAEGPTCPLNLRGVTSVQHEVNSKSVSLEVKGKGCNEFFPIRARTVKDFAVTPQAVSKKSLQYAHLSKLDPEQVCYDEGQPRLLIGADNWHLIVTRKLLTGKSSEPAASLTHLGWTVHGTIPRAIKASGTEETVLHVVSGTERPRLKDKQEKEPCDTIEELMRQHFEIDALGISLTKKIRPEDERAKEIFERTAKRVNNRFQVRLPWREDNVQLPPSYEMALRRLKTLERKMDKSPEFARQYRQQVDNLFVKGYATEYNGEEDTSTVQWFLPHFAVTNPNKPGKVRLVFDAAAQMNGTSLNDRLLDGPDLLRSLPGILFRFRERPVAVTADIREMFLQVKIHPNDQPAQSFLWRTDRDEPPKRYKMTSMIFGARSSPFLAHSVRDKNARDFAKTHPHAFKAITESHYMDDLVDSYDSMEEAAQTVKELQYVHAQAGFTLAGWTSNYERVLETVPEDLRAQAHTTELGGKPELLGKTLGLIWISSDDALGFNTSMNRVPPDVKILSRAPTKREALCAVMSIYDPLGLVSHFTITAKIILQNLWRSKVGWDEGLPEQEAEDFQRWLQNLDNISKLRLPRCYDSKGEVVNKQLHIFSDASEAAYATTAYWRMEHYDGTVNVVLAAAKAKVAPIKTQSIPRLELQANLIGARLADTILKEHRWRPDKIVYWSDSTTALHWIRNNKTRYTPFVANRLGEIAELTEPNQWRWLPTQGNPADDATRPYSNTIKETDRWFTGPAFLHEQEHKWPTETATEQEEEDKEAVYVAVNEDPHCLPDAARFSSYERLVRATARVLFFIDRCRRRSTTLNLGHIEKAEKLLIRRAQREDFAEDVQRLEEQKPLRMTSRLHKLDPFIDDEGIIRARGRIDAADVPEDMKKPIILDGKSTFTKLLVMKEHKRAGHANNERVINDLRQRFWILKLRPTVRGEAHKCTFCRLRKSLPETPAMGNLGGRSPTVVSTISGP